MTRRQIVIADGFASWRKEARAALAAGYRPEEMLFVDPGDERPRLPGLDVEASPTGPKIAAPHVPREFLGDAERAACHLDGERWNLLYRLLWRLQRERGLLKLETDTDVAALRQMGQQIGRDVHKMHAFVRFRRVEEPGPEGTTREHFIAYHQPAHRVLRLAAPFFAERFAVMRWTIMTPDETASWDPERKTLEFSAGVTREHAPEGDALEELWRSYYGAIFNPARLNPAAMKAEMPVRYWEHLPELTMLPELMQRAEGRVASMVTQQSRTPSAAPFVPANHALQVLREALPSCEGCELYKHATQAVPGRGAAHARLMMIGEQPGDQEDRQGEPFVGPAGGVLRRAMEELGIDAHEVYVTNAVKHFKFVQRGKIRLHQNPRMSEITACRPWLEAELDAVKPRVVLALGASAAKSLLGGTFRITQQRGQMLSSKYAERVMATLHPSAVLRAPDDAAREEMYAQMKGDIERAFAAAMA